MTAIVFDSSVLIAILKQETGYEHGKALFSKALVLTIKMAEVATYLARQGAPLETIADSPYYIKSNMKKLLITGSSGFLGWHLCQLAKQEWEVYGTYFSHSLEITDTKLLKVNLTDFQKLKWIFSEIQPAAVIHTAATWAESNGFHVMILVAY